MNQRQNMLGVTYIRGMGYLTVRVSCMTDADAARLADVDVPSAYDLAFYPVPRAESVPEELRELIDNPIFTAETLTREAVSARSYMLDDAGDTGGYRMRFSVAYDDILVSPKALTRTAFLRGWRSCRDEDLRFTCKKPVPQGRAFLLS